MEDNGITLLKICGQGSWAEGFFHRRKSESVVNRKSTAVSTENRGVVHIVNL